MSQCKTLLCTVRRVTGDYVLGYQRMTGLDFSTYGQPSVGELLPTCQVDEVAVWTLVETGWSLVATSPLSTPASSLSTRCHLRCRNIRVKSSVPRTASGRHRAVCVAPMMTTVGLLQCSKIAQVINCYDFRVHPVTA